MIQVPSLEQGKYIKQFKACYDHFENEKENPWFSLFGVEGKDISKNQFHSNSRVLQAVFGIPVAEATFLEEDCLPLAIVSAQLMSCTFYDFADTRPRLPSDYADNKVVQSMMKLDANKKEVSLKSEFGGLLGWAKARDVWNDDIQPALLMGEYYAAFRVNMPAISPSILLLFTRVATNCQNMNKADDRKRLDAFFPKWSVQTSQINQRNVSDLTRLWNDEEPDKPGIMQTIFGESKEKDLGSSHIVCFPYLDSLEEQWHSSNDFTHITSTYTSATAMDECFAQNERIGKFLKFEHVAKAYENLFGIKIDEKYTFDDILKLNSNVLALMAFAVLVHDTNRHFGGFNNPDTIIYDIFVYLRRRASFVIFGQEDHVKFCFGPGRTVQEMFLRVRILFQFITGGLAHAHVDGNARLTALAYAWMGIKTPRSEGELRAPYNLKIKKNPYFSIMTASLPVAFVCLSQSTPGFKMKNKQVLPLQEYSNEIQNSYSIMQETSIQSQVLLWLDLMRRQPPDFLVFLTSQLKSHKRGKLSSKAVQSALNEHSDGILSLLAEQIANTKQKDLRAAIGKHNNTYKSMTAADIVDYFHDKASKGGIRIFLPTKTILDAVLKFFAECLYADIADSEETCLQSLIYLVTNNGKTFNSFGEVRRNVGDCIKYPVEAVKDHLFPDYNTIQKMVSQAKEQGKLCPADKSKVDINHGRDMLVSKTIEVQQVVQSSTMLLTNIFSLPTGLLSE